MEESNRDRILQAATQLFGEHGFAGTSVRAVVEAAGVTKPTMYYYFSNKKALFQEVIEAQLEVLRSMVDEAIHTEGTVRERLSGFITRYVQGAIDNPAGVRLMLTVGAPADQKKTDFNIFEHFGEEISRLSKVFETRDPKLRADVDAEIAVAVVIGAADIILINALQGQPLPQNYAERIINLLFNGVQR